MAVLAACAVISCSKEQGKDNADTGIPVVIPTPTPGQTAKTVSWGESASDVRKAIPGTPEESEGDLYYADANGGLVIYGFTQDALTSIVSILKESVADDAYISRITSGYEFLGDMSDDERVYVREGANTLLQIRSLEIDETPYRAVISVPMDGGNGLDSGDPYYNVTVSRRLITLCVGGQPRKLTASLSPNGATDYFDWTSDNPSVATVEGGVVTPVSAGETDVTATSTYGVSGKCHVVVIDLPDDAVDMGTGVYWAKCNYGADSPEDVGTKLRWTSLDCSKDYEDDEDLLLEDDQVYIGTNGTWKTPTASEFKEMLNNISWTNTTVNGVRGRILKSKKNGNSIFLPITSDPSSSSELGMYWTATCYKKVISDSYYMCFATAGSKLTTSAPRIKTDDQFHEKAVRPVLCLAEE